MSDRLEQQAEVSPQTLKLYEAVLDYVRANLSNILQTMGPDSPQYKSAREIMETCLEENARKLNMKKPDLNELMGQMTLENKK